MSLQQRLLLMLIGYSVGVTSTHVPYRSATVNSDCPRGCMCLQDYIVDCGYAGLTTIPHVPPETRKLVLDGNSITEIRGDDLSRMPHLQELYLHNNRIVHISDEAFRQLLKLRLLDLSRNPLDCDCDLKSEFSERMDSMEGAVALQIVNLEGTTCTFPKQIGEQSIRVVNSRAQVCRLRGKRHPRHETFCDRDPCLNGGTCYSNRKMSGWCSCPEGFDGEFCEWYEGELLSLQVSNVTGYCIEIQWIIGVEVMDFRINSVENPTESNPIEKQEWVEGTCTTHKLSDLVPDTMYEICVAAFGFGLYEGHAKSPGDLIDEVCLYQKTDPVLSTTDDAPNSRTPQRPTSSLSSDEGTDKTKLVMTIFGVILSICVVLILAVVALYVSRRRGIMLLPRRRRRRRTPPNIVQVDNPTYSSTGSPTPSVHDLPLDEGQRPAQENNIPLILVTSASNEDIVNPNGAGFEGASTCADTQSEESCVDEAVASAKDQTCSADETEDLPPREDGDGDSSHEEDFESGQVVKDKTEPDRPEKEIIQC